MQACVLLLCLFFSTIHIISAHAVIELAHAELICGANINLYIYICGSYPTDCDLTELTRLDYFFDSESLTLH